MTRPTRQEILSAQPGQQLDAWVAEYVLGWEPWGVNSDWDDSKYFQDEQGTVVGVSGDEDHLTLGDFNPSRDWNDAMKVRDKVMCTDQQIRNFWRPLLDCSGAENYPPGSTLLSRHLLLKNLLPQHICQAALLAVCEVDETNKETKR